MIQVWHGFAITKFQPEDIYAAATFAYRHDGLVVWGDWPNTQVRHPKEILCVLN